MYLNWFRETQSKLAIFALIGLVYLTQFFGVWRIIFNNLDLPRPYDVYVVRSVNVAISIFFIWLVAPHVLQRLTFKFRARILPFAIIFTLIAGLPNIFHFGVEYQNLSHLVQGVLFAMAIGLDEEINDRGFIFGALERFGTEFALTVSALIFGLAHFPNYLFGDESFNYVLGHMLETASFGYLMAVFMLLTGNLWLPIIIHGLIDIPWVMMPPADNLEIVSGSTNWLNTLAIVAGNILIARAMMIFVAGKLELPPKLRGFARYLGLIE